VREREQGEERREKGEGRERGERGKDDVEEEK